MPPRREEQEGDQESGDAAFDVSPEVLRQLMASGNSQLVEALQRSLNKMVGQSSGYVESLPAPVRTRIEYLAELDGERAELYERYREERRALEEKYDRLYAPLYDKRAEVVNGKAEAPENETAEGKAAAAAEPDEVPAGVPDFWMIALRNAMEEETINDKDAEVLSYCTDVRCEQFHSEGEEEGDEGFRLVFSFRDNPYFTNNQLTKTYHLSEEDDMMLRKIETSGVHWKAGKDVTVKVLKKKAKPGAKGKPQTKTESVESFFRWFTEVPEIPDEEEEEDFTQEEMEALEEAMQSDFEIAEMIKEKVIPEATSWFTGEALQEYEDEEEDEDEEDEEEEDDEDGDEGHEEEEEDSEDESDAKRLPPAAADAKEQPQECKQQ